MMAASTSDSKGAAISKAEYLKRYLSADGNDKKSKEKKAKKRRVKVTGKGMKIVDDDVDWKQLNNNEEKENEEEEEEEAPVIAEMVDERPEEVKLLEAFRSSTKWKIIRADDEDVSEEDGESVRHDSPEPVSIRNTRHDSPEPLAVRRTRQDSPDPSPPRRVRHDSPGASPCRLQPGAGSRRHDSTSPPRNPKHSGRTQKMHSRDSSPSRRKTNSSSAGRTGKRSPDSDQSPPRRRGENRRGSDSDQSPPRKRTQQGRASDSDQSPPRRRPKVGQGSDSDQSPPRRRPQGGRDSDTDLSPPRRLDQSQPGMLSGGAAGLVSVEVLRREHEENRRREKINQPLEDASRNAQTVFRDKSGKRRDIETEREEQRRKAGEKAEKDEKYAQWGRGIAQGQMQQQKVKDALHETEKPLARHRDDEDLDRMLREQLRDGDPMAAMLRRKKERDAKLRGVKEKPRYKGPPPPPNRFNLHPGYRWDGVDRSSGFEQKRYSRISDKKAVEEMAYKWSVEDM